MPDPITLRWYDDELLSEDQFAVLCGPGAVFELVEEDVLGTRVKVFAQRQENLRQVLTDAASQFGDRPYFVFPDETVTFAETPARVAAIAAVLADEYGVEKGDRVAFAGANSLTYALTEWAAICSGAIVAGLNGWWTGPELAYGIELSQPKVLFCDQPRLDRLTEAGATPTDIPVVLFDDLAAQVAVRNDTDALLPDVPLDEDDPFIILFTSGTTGRPKGATLSHRNMIMFGTSSALGRAAVTLAAGGPPPAPNPPVAICGSPFFHISGTAPLLCTGPRFGTTLVFPPVGRWDPLTHLELTERYRVTTWSGVPTQFWRMLEHPEFDRFDLSSLTGISSGGAPYPPELMRILNERIPTAGLSNGYGMTECMGAGTLLFGERYLKYRDSVGAPWPAMEVQIRDEDGTVLGEGEIGEICLRGAFTFLGYWDNPEATAAVLDDDRWYLTGDYGRIENDVLYMESRMRDLILRGGENIYPMEIEHRLLEHPDIDDAAVIGVDHRTLGQEVKAFVVVRAGADLSVAEVQEWAAQSLARFKVPAYVEFRDSLPYTATGKIMKHELEREETAGE